MSLDAVISINRKYYTFVVPIITYFQNKYPNVIKLKDLIDLIDAVVLFERACNELKLNVTDVEHYIWKQNAKDSENFNMIWKNNQWIEKQNNYD